MRNKNKSKMRIIVSLILCFVLVFSYTPAVAGVSEAVGIGNAPAIVQLSGSGLSESSPCYCYTVDDLLTAINSSTIKYIVLAGNVTSGQLTLGNTDYASYFNVKTPKIIKISGVWTFNVTTLTTHGSLFDVIANYNGTGTGQLEIYGGGTITCYSKVADYGFTLFHQTGNSPVLKIRDIQINHTVLSYKGSTPSNTSVNTSLFSSGIDLDEPVTQISNCTLNVKGGKVFDIPGGYSEVYYENINCSLDPNIGCLTNYSGIANYFKSGVIDYLKSSFDINAFKNVATIVETSKGSKVIRWGDNPVANNGLSTGNTSIYINNTLAFELSTEIPVWYRAVGYYPVLTISCNTGSGTVTNSNEKTKKLASDITFNSVGQKTVKFVVSIRDASGNEVASREKSFLVNVRAKTPVPFVAVNANLDIKAGDTAGDNISQVTAAVVSKIMVSNIRWYDVSSRKYLSDSDSFTEGHKYTIEYDVYPKYGYTFTGSTGQVTLNGTTANVNSYESLTEDGVHVISKAFVASREIPSVDVSYHTHIQTLGDSQGYVSNGQMAGTSGQAKRLENIKIKVSGNTNLGIQYTTHCQTYGWLTWSANDEPSGTTGEAKRLEAIKIQLTGADKDLYDVYYRVHAQSFGWLGWAKNGEPSGTAGYAKRLEGI